ncbi:MAG: dethiobiotin synthase [Planctomycetaceae bacterium]
MKGLFVTGTDTDVGKTWITSLIAKQLRAEERRVGAYKPACSGAEQDQNGNQFWADIHALAEATDGEFPDERICPQRFRAPLAPPVAAAAEGRTIDATLLRSGIDWWRNEVDGLLIEGVGGLLCPLTETETIADFAVDLGFPTLIVSRPALGTINHTLLTLEVARQRGLHVVGVVLNHATSQQFDPEFIASNAEQIERFGETSVLGVCAFNEETLASAGSDVLAGSDWFSLFGCAE